MFQRRHAEEIARTIRNLQGEMSAESHALLVQRFAALLYYHNPRMDVVRFTKAVYEHLHS